MKFVKVPISIVMRPSVHQISSQRIVALARGFQTRCVEDASGRCLSLSLDVALEAKRKWSLDLNLVRWRVVDDPDYVEHWAVMLDDERVIDATRLQVDDERALVCDVASYPTNFKDRRCYPASLLMWAYQDSSPWKNVRLSNRFLWTCATRLMAFDLLGALRERNAVRLISALRSGKTFLRCFLMNLLTRALAKRAKVLLDRLRSMPDVAARGSSRAPIALRHRHQTARKEAPAMAMHPVLASAQTLAPTADLVCALLLMCA